MKQQRIFTDLPVTRYVLACQSTPYEQHKKGSRREDLPAHKKHTEAEDLYTHAEAYKIYIREHHILPVKLSCRRVPSPSEALSTERNLSSGKVPH